MQVQRNVLAFEETQNNCASDWHALC